MLRIRTRRETLPGATRRRKDALKVILALLLLVLTIGHRAISAERCGTDLFDLTADTLASRITDLARLQLNTIQDKTLPSSARADLQEDYERQIVIAAQRSRRSIGEIRQLILKEKQRLFFGERRPFPRTSNEERRRELKQLPARYVHDRVLLGTTASNGKILSVAFSPNGKWLASGTSNGVRLWNLETEDFTPRTLTGPLNWIPSVAFSPDSKWLASGSTESGVQLWDLGSKRVKPTIHMEYPPRVWSVAFSPDGKTLASGSSDESLWLWNLTAKSPKPRLLAQLIGWWVETIAFSPNGKWLANGASNNAAWLWNLEAVDSGPTPLVGHEGLVRSVAFSPNGKWIATGSNDKTVRLWDLEAEDFRPMILPVPVPYGAVTSVAFRPDSKVLASGADQTVQLWDLEGDPTIFQTLRETAAVNSIAFSPDGSRLATGSEHPEVHLWRAIRAAELDTP